MEGLLLNPVEIPVDKQDKWNKEKYGYEKKQYKEVQHQKQYILKSSVQENKYIVNYINYIPKYFIKRC